MGRIKVSYREYNPNEEGVSHIAIAIVNRNLYVWCVYFARPNLPESINDIIVVPKDIAFKLFEFSRE